MPDSVAYDSLLQPNALLVRYDEIAMKGGNRARFERALVRRLRAQIDPAAELQIHRERGRIFVTRPDAAALGTDVLDAVRTRAKRVFGLSSVSPGILIERTLEALEQCVDRILPALYEEALRSLPDDQPVRYAMRARRHGLGLGMSSQELEIHFADRLLPAFPRLKVDLDRPDLRIEVETRAEHTIVSCERISGPGGLPVGCSGTVLALLSGGIDSPVACRQMMKRGCRLHFVTFHSAPYTPPETVEKVGRLVEVLNQYQYPGRLFAINLLPFQKLVRDHCRGRFRTLIYRRAMVRFACLLAERMHAGALVTGDCLGQVASQTLRNLNCIDAAADRTILRPLIGFDKKEAVEIARDMGTLDISNEPYPDSCTVFAPASPATGAHVKDLEREEECLRRAAPEPTPCQQFPEAPPMTMLAECLEQSFEVDLAARDPIPFAQAISAPSQR